MSQALRRRHKSKIKTKRITSEFQANMDKKNNNEYIICAAIHFDDGNVHVHQPKNIDTGFVVAGWRHHNCFATLAIISKKTTKQKEFAQVQGFLTNTGRFVDREEGAKIALGCKQIARLNYGKNILYSEDLY